MCLHVHCLKYTALYSKVYILNAFSEVVHDALLGYHLQFHLCICVLASNFSVLIVNIRYLNSVTWYFHC